MKRVCLCLLGVIVLSGCASLRRQQPAFESDVTTKMKPWTHLRFRNDPDAFQFAIVSDRNGGMRPGVFPEAVERLNWLQPEFVISVGDLIPGYTEDAIALARQWREFQGFVEGLEMPFFFVGGNHDLSNNLMLKLWQAQFGTTHYSFVYRDVLFICLDTQDGVRPEAATYTRTGLGPGQIRYVKSVLRDHPDARWTMVFMHQPVWVYKGNNAMAFAEIEAALADRRHTVFAGHFHKYAKYEKKNANYYILATTGAVSSLRGQNFGEFDHVVWVTMTPQGPKLVNLTLDGMLPDDVVTDLTRSILTPFEKARVTWQTGVAGDIKVKYVNRHPQAVELELEWDIPEGAPWTITPARMTASVSKGDKVRLQWEIVLRTRKLEPHAIVPLMPALILNARTPAGPIFEDLRMANVNYSRIVEQCLKLMPPSLQCNRLAERPVIDGRLDDAAWQSRPQINALTPLKLAGPASDLASGWIGYDDMNLYIAVNCREPYPDNVRTEATRHDGPVWDDDSIELFFDTDLDRKTFYQLVINAAGTVYDGTRDGGAWQAEFDSAVGSGQKSWFLEVAIPWQTIGLNGPPVDGRIGFNLVRNRTQATHRVIQWAPTSHNNFMPHLFGYLEF